MRHAVALVVVVACGGEAPKPVVLANTSDKPAEDWTTVTGTWIGTAFQYDNRNHWPVTIVLHKALPGDVMGTIDYPSYQCGGNLIRQSYDDSAIVVTEAMVRLGNSCVDGATLRIRRVGAEIDVQWIWAGMTEVNARASLHLLVSGNGA